MLFSPNTNALTTSQTDTQTSALPTIAALPDCQYGRSGSDLIIEVLGQQIVVEGYFLNPTDLYTVDGSRLATDLLLQAQHLDAPILLAARGNVPVGAKEIGTVTLLVNGPVFAQRPDGSKRTLAKSDPVYLEDTIITSTKGYIKISLQDGSVFQLGPLSRASLDKYHYEPTAADSKGEFEANVFVGVFRFVSGGISGDGGARHTTIKTPAATIGIRGSEIDGRVNLSGDTEILHYSGYIEVYPRFIPSFDMYIPGQWAFVPNEPIITSYKLEIAEPSYVKTFRELLLPLNPEANFQLHEEIDTRFRGGAEGDIELDNSRGDELDSAPKPPSKLQDERLPDERGEEGDAQKPLVRDDKASSNRQGQSDATTSNKLKPPTNDQTDNASEQQNPNQDAELPPQSDVLPPPSNPNTTPNETGNHIPVTAEDQLTVAEDQVLNIDSAALLANDQDADGDALHIVEVHPSDNPHGELSLSEEGVITYRPAPNFNGNDSFTYIVEDEQGGRSEGTVTLNVTAVNDAPVGQEDELSVLRQDVINIDVARLLANDNDVDSSVLQIVAVDGAQNGTVTLVDSTMIQFRPDANATTAEFDYIVSDGELTSRAEVQLQLTVPTTPDPVTPPATNTSPVATNDVTSLGDSDTGVVAATTLLSNDVDADGDSLQLISVNSLDTELMVRLLADGDISISRNPDFDGSAQFSYIISDGRNTSQAVVTVTGNININTNTFVPVDDSLTQTTAKNNNVVLSPTSLLANDTGTGLTISGVSAANNGEVSLLSNGNIEFSPTLGFSGIASFTYTVTDADGNSADATVTLTFSNTPPTAVNDQLADTFNNTALSLSSTTLLANDSDPNGDVLTLTSVDNPLNGSVTLDASTGSITFTPTPNATGLAGFSYTVSDGDGGTTQANVEFNLLAPDTSNTLPIAVDDTLADIPNDTPLLVSSATLLANDSDPDGDALTIVSVTSPLNGTVALNAIDGGVTFTPNANATGAAGFSYTISDGNGATAQANVQFNLLALPTANDDSFSATKNQLFTIPTSNLLINDTPTGALTVTAVGTTPDGNVNLNGTTVEFTPNTGFSGTTNFTYTVSNANNATDTATITIEVVNTPPVANPVNFNTLQNQALSLAFNDLLNQASDPDGDTISLSIDDTTAVSGTVNIDSATQQVTFTPATDFIGNASFNYTITDSDNASDTGVVTIAVTAGISTALDQFNMLKNQVLNLTTADLLGNDTPAQSGDTLRVVSIENVANATANLSATGDIVVTPTRDFTGNVTFVYRVKDNNGNEATGDVTVEVKNGQPQAQDDTFATFKDQALQLSLDDLLGNDSDPDGDTLNIVSVSNAQNGQVVLNDDGSIEFTPDAGFVGSSAQFSYTINDDDPNPLQAIATVRIEVSDQLVAQPDKLEMDSNSSKDLPQADLLANDVSANSSDTLTISAINSATDIAVEILNNGDLRLTPADDFIGKAEFTYIVESSSGEQARATVSVNVLNQAPEAVDDRLDMLVNEVLTINPVDLLINDNDPEGKTLQLISVDNPSNGEVQRDLSGNIIFTPTVDFVGISQFRYTIEDSEGVQTDATVSIEVFNENLLPVAEDDSVDVSYNTEISIPLSTLLSNDSDPDPTDVLQFVDVVAGTTSDNIDSIAQVGNELRLFIDALVNEGEDATFDYRIEDSQGDSADASVTIAANNILHGTDADDMLVSSEDANIVFGFAGNDTFSDIQANDILSGGNGDDTFEFDPDNAGGVIIAAGTGTDTLALSGDGQILDLVSNQSAVSGQQFQLSGLERIDLGTGSNQLRLDISDVLDITESGNLRVDGSGGSVVTSTAQGWNNDGSVTVDGTSYTQYSSGSAQLLVNSDILFALVS